MIRYHKSSPSRRHPIRCLIDHPDVRSDVRPLAASEIIGRPMFCHLDKSDAFGGWTSLYICAIFTACSLDAYDSTILY